MRSVLRVGRRHGAGVRFMTRDVTAPSERLANGIPFGWITSPGPIAGAAVQLNLSSLDALLPSQPPATPGAETDQRPAPQTVQLGQAGDEGGGHNGHLGLIPFILEKFAFKKTARLSEEALQTRLERLIGSATANNHRHTLLWSCAVPEAQLADAVALLGEVCAGPGRLTDEDVEEVYRMLQYEARDLRQPLRFEDMLRDLVHRAAFDPTRTIVASASPVLFAAEDESRKSEVCALIKRAGAALQTYWTDCVLADPSRHFCVVGGGAGDASETVFIRALESALGTLPSRGTGTESLPSSSSSHVGGMVHWETEDSALCNLSLALQTPPASSDASFPLAVLQMLLGGGGSFSAGGPGKGMYSRLYTQMLNRYSWLESARVFSVAYPSCRVGGLFGINASCLPERAPVLIRLLLAHLSTHLASSLTTAELSRAKNQVKSALLMGMEARMLQLENFAEQLAGGKCMSPAQLCRRIDAVTETELAETVRTLVSSSRLSVVAYGQTAHVPSYSAIESAFTSDFLPKLRV